MIVECSNCHARYNVDEKKIPPTGVKAKCHKCQNIIFIKKELPSPQPIESEVPTAPPEPGPGGPEGHPEQVPKAEPSVEQPIPEVPKEKVPEAPPPREAEPKPAPPSAEEMSEEDIKWHKRAKRLAKALASDLVLYNQDKVEQGLREGKEALARLLGSEIRRSWEYYCQQIPKHIVESTDYFKEQLNNIVGKGREIFK